MMKEDSEQAMLTQAGHAFVAVPMKVGAQGDNAQNASGTS